MVLTFLAAMVAVSSCNKDENETVNNAASTVALKTTTLSTLEAAMTAELSEESLETVMQCAYDCLNQMPAEELSQSEIDAITFVREEELLAHDVYQALHALYPVPVFNFISNSEALHAWAMKVLLDKYALPDPAADHQAGVFTNPAIQQLYNDLVAFGLESIGNALTVGAIIEDYDIADIIQHTGNDVDNQDMIYAFNQLHKGSRNHMRAFNAHLNFRNLTYTPQYISQSLFDEITSSGWEIGQGFCQCQCSTAAPAAAKIIE